MRARPVPLVACLAVVAVGCGGGEEKPAPRALAPVVLELTEPSDEAVVRTSTVRVRGSVSPAGADVRVDGRAAEQEGETFSLEVSLEPGANVLDVIASARGRAPVLTAIRVTREMPVEVPDVTGLATEEAESRLSDAGLEPEVHDGGGLFDGLLPGEPAVCAQEPEAGAMVRRGTVVAVSVAKRC
jgi:PASTA domain/Glucodextranase, domain B